MTDIIATVQYEDNVTVSTVGIQGLSASDAGINMLSDVDVSNLENGSLLVYKTNTNKWTSTRLLDQQFMEGGEF